MVHDQFTDNAALHFLPALAVEFLFNLFYRVFDLTHWQRTFLACLANTNREFLTIKGFASLVAFHHHQVKCFNPLIGAKASFALLAFPSAMNRITNIS